MGECAPLLDCPVHHRQPGDGSANNGRYWRYCGARGCELSTAWVLSRNEAITSWNDLVARVSKLVERKSQEATMTERKPLAGWRDEYGRWRNELGKMAMVADAEGEWYVECEGVYGCVGNSTVRAQLAAEDAARAMVAGMAAALGGSVTWGESEVSECR